MGVGVGVRGRSGRREGGLRFGRRQGSSSGSSGSRGSSNGSSKQVNQPKLQKENWQCISSKALGTEPKSADWQIAMRTALEIYDCALGSRSCSATMSCSLN